MKSILCLSLLLSGLSPAAFAESFEQLKSRADAYRDSGQLARDQAAQAAIEWRKHIPIFNRKVLTQAAGIARNLGGAVGGVAASYSADGEVLAVEFVTRTAWRCRTSKDGIEFLDCVNERTLQQKEGLIRLMD